MSMCHTKKRDSFKLVSHSQIYSRVKKKGRPLEISDLTYQKNIIKIIWSLAGLKVR